MPVWSAVKKGLRKNFCALFEKSVSALMDLFILAHENGYSPPLVNIDMLCKQAGSQSIIFVIAINISLMTSFFPPANSIWNRLISF